MVAHTCDPSYVRDGSRRIFAYASKNARLNKKKITIAKKSRGVAQLVEFLTSKCEDLNSNYSTTTHTSLF
jgi:isocitrate/isopropylmalate dehydrogenase